MVWWCLLVDAGPPKQARRHIFCYHLLCLKLVQTRRCKPNSFEIKSNMNETGTGSRKRKKPSYLEDFYDSPSVEVPVSTKMKKVSFNSQNKDCIIWDISTPINL